MLGRDRASYAGRHILVIGASYSATNVLIDLVRLARDNSWASVTWVVRGISLMRVLVRSHAECAAWYRDQAALTRRRTRCMLAAQSAVVAVLMPIPLVQTAARTAWVQHSSSSGG